MAIATSGAWLLFFDYPSKDESDGTTHAADQSETYSCLQQSLIDSLNSVCRWAQEPPKLAHVEILLLLPNETRCHFATYLGARADWVDPGEFYLSPSVRAVPLPATLIDSATNSDVERLLQACQRQVSPTRAPYSLSRYAFGLRQTRWLSKYLASEADGNPAHCSGLSARVLKKSFQNWARDALPMAATAYTPSSLYNAVVKDVRRTSEHTRTQDLASAPPQVAEAVRALLLGSHVDVCRLEFHVALSACNLLSERVRKAVGDAVDANSTEVISEQRALARAACRVAYAFCSNSI
jgi:hypothetical protein